MADLFQSSLSEAGVDDTQITTAVDCFSRGDFAEALRFAEIIVAAAPKIAMAWQFRGECFFQLGFYDAAAACFNEAHQLGGPGTEEVMIWLALSQRNAGQDHQAERSLQDFLAELPPGREDLREKGEHALRMIRQDRWRAWWPWTVTAGFGLVGALIGAQAGRLLEMGVVGALQAGATVGAIFGMVAGILLLWCVPFFRNGILRS